MKTALEFLRKASKTGFLPRMSPGLAGRGSIAGLIVLAGILAASPGPASGAGPYTLPNLAQLTYTIPVSALTPAFLSTCLIRFDDAGLASNTGGEYFFSPVMCYTTDAASFPPPPPPYPDIPYYDLPGLFLGPADFHSDTGTLVLGKAFYCAELEEGLLAFGLKYNIQLDKSGAGTGTATLYTDATDPYDCADGSQATGSLTLTPLTDGPTRVLVSITCDNTPLLPGTRHFTTAAPHQMLSGGTVEITGAVPAAWNGRYPVVVDSPTVFHSIPKDAKNVNRACPAANTIAGSYTPVHDSDGDNCPDYDELGNNPAYGGLRDPFNPYDYSNPTNDELNRVDDILKVVNQYFIDDPVGMPDLKSNTDRTGIVGGNPWNLGPPNGLQRVDDILAQVKQYFHDC